MLGNITKRILKWIGPQRVWRLYRNELIGEYHKDIHDPITAKELEFAFADLDGIKYYKFPYDQALPVERMGKIQEYLMWISAGLNGEQIDQACEVADKLITDGIQHGKNAAKLGALFEEMRLRRGAIAPVDLFYNYLAVQYIREDENPKTFNPSIQDEKVAAFKRGADTQDSFFFANPLLETLSAILREPNKNWLDILKESQVMRETWNKKMQYLGTLEGPS